MFVYPSHSDCDVLSFHPLYILFQDVLTGEVDTIIAMVGLLMFATNPLKEEKDINNTSKLLGEQTRMTSEMLFCHGRLSYALRAVQEVIEQEQEYFLFLPIIYSFYLILPTFLLFYTNIECNQHLI